MQSIYLRYNIIRYDTIYAACRAWDSGTSLPALTTVTLPATAQRFLLKLSLSWVITRVFHTLCLSVSRTRCILYCCRRCLSHTLSVYSPRPVAWHRPRLICLLFCYETKLCQGQIYMNTLSAGDVCLCSCAAWLAEPLLCSADSLSALQIFVGCSLPRCLPCKYERKSARAGEQ